MGSARDLEREFQLIGAHFQGKETEDNWQLREKDFHKIRALLRGEAVSHYKDTFVACITKLLDAITDSVLYYYIHIQFILRGLQFATDYLNLYSLILGLLMLFLCFWLHSLVYVSLLVYERP